MKQQLFTFALAGAATALSAQTTVTLDSTVLEYRTVIDGIDIPWEIIWGPDGHIWTTERYGRVSRIDPATGTQTVILNLSSGVYDQSESGLLGMALHPDFANHPEVFLVYTYLQSSNILERLVRYEYDGTNLVNPDTLLEGIQGNTTHIGSRLLMLPDQTLLMTTGDAQDWDLPQDVNSLSGKVLRMNLDGTAPADNPIPGSLVWTWGHRNPQGMLLAPNGKIYCSEHGPTTDDELHILMSGRNYGWPTVTGYCDSPPETQFCTDSNVVEPLTVWTPTIAPSDLAWYPYPNIPEWENKLLMTVLKDKELIAFGLDATGDAIESSQTYFQNQFNRLRDICIAPDGRVFLATNGASWSNNNPFTHEIIELKPPTNVGVADLSTAPLAQVAPNPLRQGQPLWLRLATEKPATLRLFDVLGQVVETQTTANSGWLNVDLARGVYVYELEQDGHRQVGKLVVE